MGMSAIHQITQWSGVISNPPKFSEKMSWRVSYTPILSSASFLCSLFMVEKPPYCMSSGSLSIPTSRSLTVQRTKQLPPAYWPKPLP